MAKRYRYSRMRTRRLRRRKKGSRKLVTQAQLVRTIRSQQNAKVIYQDLQEPSAGMGFWDCQFGTHIDKSANNLSRIGNDAHLTGLRFAVYFENKGLSGATGTVDYDKPVQDYHVQILVFQNKSEDDPYLVWFQTSDGIPLAYNSGTLNDSTRVIHRINNNDINVLYSRKWVVAPPFTNSATNNPFFTFNKYIPMNKKIIWKSGSTPTPPYTIETIQPRICVAVIVTSPQRSLVLGTPSYHINAGVYWYWRD